MTPSLDQAINRNFLLKTKVMMAVFGIIFIFQIIGATTSYLNGIATPTLIKQAAFVPIFLLIIFSDQYFLLRYIKRKISQKKEIKPYLIYIASFLESSFPTVVLVYGAILSKNIDQVNEITILNSPPESLYFVFIVLSALVMDARLTIIMSIVCGLEYFSLLFFFSGDLNNVELAIYFAKPIIMILFGVVTGLITRTIRLSVIDSLESQRILIEELDNKVQERTHEISHQKEIIEEKNKEIVDSINYAKRIQDAYLPPSDVLQHYFPESFLLFKPKDIVSGDFYWFFSPKGEEKSPDRLFVAVADCTGHGVPGAIMSVICCNALNEAVITRKIRDTGKILDVVRETIIRDLKSTKIGNQKDGMDIALISIHRKTNLVEYSGANNPLWFLKKGENEISELKPDKQPVGMYDNIIPFKVQQLNMGKGDQLFLFSDGFADQFGGEKGKKFKYANLQKLFLKYSDHPFNDLDKKLNDAFENWRGDLEQVDDVCMIGIKL